MRYLPIMLSSIALIASVSAIAVGDSTTGVLDVPLNDNDPVLTLGTQRPETGEENSASDPQAANDALRARLDSEKTELQQLPRPELQQRAEQGERAAQLTLAEDFAKEATLLSFAPEAANDALSDSARWYALAAQRGFPGAPSLDQAGVQFYPIRAQRSR